MLNPGESAEVFTESFKHLMPEGRGSTKREDAAAPREPLTPAEYTFKASMSFFRTFKEDGGALTPKFVGTSRARYNNAWSGTIEGSATFRVVD